MNDECRHLKRRGLHRQVLEHPGLGPHSARDTDREMGGYIGGRLGQVASILAVTLNMFGQLGPASELVATLMTLIWRDTRVSHLVLVQIPLVGELLVAELAGEAEHFGMDRLFVLLDIFGIGRHVAADVTDSVSRVLIGYCLIIQVDPVNIPFV